MKKRCSKYHLLSTAEEFSSLKENSVYLEAAKNGAILCGIEDGVMKWVVWKRDLGTS